MTTTKTLSYRLRQRNQRTVTTPCTYQLGMFYTDFVVPDKYAKVLVNYDINDSSGALATRAGKLNETVLLKDVRTRSDEQGTIDIAEYGEPHLTDFLYTSKADNFNLQDVPEVEGFYDSIISFGKPMKMSDVIPANVLSDNIKDRTVIAAAYLSVVTNNGVSKQILGNHCWGAIQTNKEDWGLFTEAYAYPYNTPSTLWNYALGAITAKTIHNARIFDCPVTKDIIKPIYTVLNGEIYAFSIPAIEYLEEDGHVEVHPNNVNKFELSKLFITEYNPDLEQHKHYNIRRRKIEPMKLSAFQASTGGFNLLLDEPYKFKNQVGATDIEGMLYYESSSPDAKPVSTNALKLGYSYFLRVYVDYNAGVNYEVKWEYSKEGKEGTWEDLSDGFENIGTITDDTIIGKDLLMHDTYFYIKVTIREANEPATERVTSFAYMTIDEEEKTLELKNWDLSSAQGMFTWRHLIGLWGVKDAEDTIFFSDVDNPAYFSYYGIQTFDGKILNVIPMNDTLIVWTVDGCYAMTGGPTYSTMQTAQVLTNIHLTPLDAELCTVLKDQLFFQLDHAFYVLKPNANTSDATDLKNYLNSVAIADLLNNFKPRVLQILNDMYAPIITKAHAPMHNIGKHGIQDFEITGVYSQISNSVLYYTCKIHPIFKYEQILNDMFIHLLYDPATRTWRIHTEGLMDGGIEHASPLRHKDKNTNIVYTINPFKFNRQFIVAGIAINKFDKDHISDNFTLDMKDEDGNNIDTNINADNYQFLDTGHPAIDDRPVKRFRELQLVIQNKNLDTIRFFSEFLIDGHKTVDTTHYDVKHIIDPTDPAYGQIYVAPTMIENLELYGDTHLENNTDDGWQLDLSQFPNLESVTIRFELFGKGRHARYKLISADLKRYELSSIVWVTRTMNAR